jgi:hypothetical protein
VKTHEVRSREVIKVVREGGHLAEDLLVQRLSTLEVLWRSGLELPEASEPEIMVGH